MLANGTGLGFGAAIWAEILKFSVKKHVVLDVLSRNQSCVEFVFSLLFSTNLVLENGTGPEFSAAIWAKILQFWSFFLKLNIYAYMAALNLRPDSFASTKWLLNDRLITNLTKIWFRAENLKTTCFLAKKLNIFVQMAALNSGPVPFASTEWALNYRPMSKDVTNSFCNETSKRHISHFQIGFSLVPY